MKIDDEVLKKMKSAKTAFALTGAGSSAPSGIPTFRGSDGFWKDKTPFNVEEFNKDPQRVWQWHQEIKELIKKKWISSKDKQDDFFTFCPRMCNENTSGDFRKASIEWLPSHN